MSLNLNDLMMTGRDVMLLMEKHEYLGVDELSGKDVVMFAHAAVAKFVWGLVEDTNLIREVDKGEWRDALEAAGIQRPGAKP